MIREIYERVVSVEAETESEAIEIVSNEYAEMEDYEINQDDFVDAEFEILKNNEV